MRQYLFHFVFLLLVQLPVFTQESTNPEIVTDRPDQTESPFIVPKNTLQIESGFMASFDENATRTKSNFVYNSTLLRYGILETIELRFIAEYLGEFIDNKETGNTSSIKGFSPVTAGIKVFITEERGIIPQSAILVHLLFPGTGKDEFSTNYLGPFFRMTFQHTLSEKFSLGYNIGAEWDGLVPEASAVYSLVLGYSLNEKIAVFSEFYGDFPEEGKNEHKFDAGFAWLLANNFQIDLAFGLGINNFAPDKFITTGISWRIPR
ncbi:MAG: transporter [Bacteroidota bacterium]